MQFFQESCQLYSRKGNTVFVNMKVIPIFLDSGGDPVREGDDLPLDGEHPGRGHQALGGQSGEGRD